MACSDQAVPSIVTRSTHHKYTPSSFDKRVSPAYSVSTAQTGNLHELVNRELVLIEKHIIKLPGSLLTKIRDTINRPISSGGHVIHCTETESTENLVTGCN